MENKGNTNFIMKSLLYFMLIVFIFLGGFYLGKVDLYKKSIEAESANYQISGDLKSEVNDVDVNLLWEVWAKLEEEYIESDINGQELLYGAVKGLVKGLDDPYTSFLDPNETQEYLSANKGEFEGIGTTLKQEGEFVAIESPIDDSPAQKAGLMPGDLILEVDGQDMQGISVFDVAAKIRGEAGTRVSLLLFRQSTTEQLSVEIVRQKIDLDNISLSKLEDGIYEIKIYKFTEETIQAFNKQWDKVVEDLIAQNPEGIVIDLRNNPGGYVNSVEYVLGEFLPKGSVVFIEEDKYGNQIKYKVNRNGKLQDIPVVVIVNSGSASASEIFAGAIQDHERAIVIGEKTVGKGVEQKLIELSDGSTVQIVFQKWLTPNGKNINKDEPISPDIEVTDYDKQDTEAIERLKKLL